MAENHNSRWSERPSKYDVPSLENIELICRIYWVDLGPDPIFLSKVYYRNETLVD